MNKDVTNAELLAEVKRLSKRANQRLVRLERSELKSETLKGAKSVIKSYLGRDTGRYVYNNKMTRRQLKKELKAINSFLNLKTSTVSGQKKVYKQAKKTLEANFDVKLKKSDEKKLYDFLSSNAFKRSTEMYGNSDEVVVGFFEAQEQGNLEDFLEEIKMNFGVD